METKMILARNLKSARDRLGYTQAKLAELADTSAAFIGEIEIGRKSPSLEKIGQIAEALGMEVYQLLIDPEQPQEVADRQELLSNLQKDLQTRLSSEIDKAFREYLLR